MTLRDLQPDALAALDAVVARADEVVTPALLEGAQERITWLVAGGPEPAPTQDPAAAAAFAVVEQELMDVARVDDAVVRTAADAIGGAQLADLVMASYALEARTRLEIAASRLLGGAS